MSTMIAKIVPLFNHERLLSKLRVIEGTNCWEFQGCITSSGYGQMSIASGSRYYTHRLTWSIFKGSLDSKMVIDHICRNTRCCNPDHLREVTRKINTIENSIGRAAKNSIKTQCINGHPFDHRNTYRYKNMRYCRICKSNTSKRIQNRSSR